MQQFLNNGVRTIFVVIAILGLTGAVVFFPINIGDRYTCLYHRYVAADMPAAGVDGAMPGHHTAVSGSDAEARHHLHAQYMGTFRFVWWGSLALLLIGISGIKSIHKPPQHPAKADNPKIFSEAQNELTKEYEE
jgi:hypothetical protein